jgi:hypothetical protein
MFFSACILRLMQATSCSSEGWEHLSQQPSGSLLEAVAEHVRSQLDC